MNRTRSHPRILQVLLALLFLAWLPATGTASAQDEYAVQFAGAASLEEWGEDGEGWAGLDGGSDGDPSDPAGAPAPSRHGQGGAPQWGADRRAIWLDAAHPATGPPAV